jgi:peptidylprolyl isomerase
VVVEALNILSRVNGAPKLMSKISKHRGTLVLAAFAAAGAIAGCGSSETTIAPGHENQNALAEAKQQERLESKSSSTSTTTTSTSSTATTPSSGPLSKEPTVKPPSGPAPTTLVTKEVVKGTGPVAKAGDTVTVNYVGVLYKTGKVFNASWETKQPLPFVLGQGQVIPGWDKGVVGMRVGGRRELIIPAAEAYGKAGRPPKIPPNSPLVFVVDLLAV